MIYIIDSLTVGLPSRPLTGSGTPARTPLSLYIIYRYVRKTYMNDYIIKIIEQETSKSNNTYKTVRMTFLLPKLSRCKLPQLL